MKKESEERECRIRLKTELETETEKELWRRRALKDNRRPAKNDSGMPNSQDRSQVIEPIDFLIYTTSIAMEGH